MTDYAEFARLEREGWGDADIAGSYGARFAAATAQAAPSLAAAVTAAPGRAVLDLCCGPGPVSAVLVEQGARVTGLDFSAAMLAQARTRVPGATFVEGDAQAMPFADASFDAATCGFGLMHIPDQDRALAELRRVLRPGAPFAFTVWAPAGASPGFEVIAGALAKGDPSVALPPAPDFHRFADPATAEALLTAAGFHDVSLTPLDVRMPLARPGEFFEIMREGAVRIGMLIEAQPPAARPAVEAAFETGVRDWALANGVDPSAPFALPLPAVMVLARA
ncbi:methyltransferase domain-containing protein [Albimonas sp. CAU 1670]|uniref:class I SAM-dependent methyltransferase n=1 Tax=Albimonas sp. CAU 1670 TaxID=3032599 RepID=UPI0023DB0420|nr:methyltransferase domain-containing protein [Albimonas sp. CAU 1670]MDF2234026.1 methyltransferase domain-containing protein [Albimonas sp. CAU 1670]